MPMNLYKRKKHMKRLLDYRKHQQTNKKERNDLFKTDEHKKEKCRTMNRSLKKI